MQYHYERPFQAIRPKIKNDGAIYATAVLLYTANLFDAITTNDDDRKGCETYAGSE